MAKAPTAAKPGGKPKAPSKSEVLNNLAAATNLSRKEVAAVSYFVDHLGQLARAIEKALLPDIAPVPNA